MQLFFSIFSINNGFIKKVSEQVLSGKLSISYSAMDKGKVRGDYASAYKLSGSRSTVDKKTLRIHRRSVEQRELRHEAHNKRRPLVDLSPVHEGDQSNVNKHYKDKTPVKTRGTAMYDVILLKD